MASSVISIKYKCGHTQNTDLSAVPAGKRKAHAYGLGKHRVCLRCFKAGNDAERQAFLEKKNAETLAESEVFEETHQLPPLVGGVKQVSWATRIRYELFSSALEELAEDDFAALLQEAQSVTRAGWWIDNNDMDVEDLLEFVSTAGDAGRPREESENPF
ncbi:hypothetical protein [Arthrobacter woluwensis]|uniref:Uncharacterized protein n=1 Tax=Arthrobacter woluwensis TaxID=156980 RepID=A0A1H4I738_9MICC|nr:hypothetical protein [Arthrobacter woluwensis]SEB29771.1 hypothetical protein SAMN04489745_0080 [Arthrobacter woluwensis]